MEEEECLLNRLCHTCRCLRPLRAKHCRICDRCVSYFDHHCPFIYNCVGLRNRMWFFLFVMSIAVNCSFMIYFSTYCIAMEGFGVVYILGLVEAFVFSGLGWMLTCTSVSSWRKRNVVSGSNYYFYCRCYTLAWISQPTKCLTTSDILIWGTRGEDTSIRSREVPF